MSILTQLIIDSDKIICNTKSLFLFSSLKIDEQNNDSSEITVDDQNADILNPIESKIPPSIYINIVNYFKSYCFKIQLITKCETFSY